MMKIYRLAAILILLLAACKPDRSQDISRQLDAYLTGLEQNQAFSGAVLIARDGEILLSKGYGLEDREAHIPNTPHTRYRIHWITMPFTAMAVLQLQAEGKLHVQDPICQYIPDCPEYWQGITIHHLLTHTSGVADGVRPWGSKAAKPTMGMERVVLIKDSPPYFLPGEQLRYSGNGYVILGAIIEKVSGLPYDRYLQERIFEPLGMQDSGYEGGDLAVGYSSTGDEAPTPDLLFRYSAGGLYSTVEDLYLWDQTLYGEKLVAQEYFDMMFSGYAETPSVDFAGAEYGYGWFVGETLDRRLIFHGGSMPGYSGGIMRFPDERVTIIVLRNVELQVYDRMEIELAMIVFGENRSE